jgi:hypothetical protein
MAHFLNEAEIGTKRSSEYKIRIFCSLSNEDITNNLDFELLDDFSSLAFLWVVVTKIKVFLSLFIFKKTMYYKFQLSSLLLNL